MSIYSANRTGSMALAQVAANESYTSEDFGRILYETQVNDMAFFEAVLACDFNEIKGLREGTILESEVAALNEASSKGIIEKLRDGLKKFWQKIKGAIKNAIDKVTAWTLSYGKKTVKRFNDTVNMEKGFASWSGKVTDIPVFNLEADCFKIPKDALSIMMKTEYNHTTDTNSAAIVGRLLKNKIGGSEAVSTKDFRKKALEKSMSKVKLTYGNVDEFKKAVSNASEYVAALKSTQREAEASINAAMTELKDLAKSTTDKKDKKTNIAKVSSIVHAYQSYVTIITSTAIAAARMDLSSRNKALVKVMNINSKSDAVKEANILDATDSFNEFMTSTLVLDEATRAEIDSIVESI